MEPDIPESAIEEAAAAIMSAANMNDDEPERFEARVLATAALEAAAPLLAKAWGVARPRERIEVPGAWPRTAPNPDDPTGLTVIPLPDPEVPGA